MKCQYCLRIAKSKTSNIQHEIRCKENPNGVKVKPSYGMLGKKGANQYTYGAKMTNEVREKISQASKKQVWSEDRKINHRASMKRAVENNPESYTSSNRGRTKQIEYDGIKFQGQWELDFYKWAKDQGLNPQRPNNGFAYQWNGERTYFPDFYIQKFNAYVEVKGYETDRDRAKWSQFPEKLVIIKEEQIKEIRKNTFKGIDQ